MIAKQYVTLLALAILVSAVAAQPELQASNHDPSTKCKEKYGWTRATFYNETLNKCVLHIGDACDKSWPVAEIQCGVTYGVCLHDQCKCELDFFEDWRNAVDSQFGLRPICSARTLRLHEACLLPPQHGRHRPDHECVYPLQCLFEKCKCTGVWNEVEATCYTTKYCENKHFSSAYVDRDSKSCKCPIGSICTPISDRKTLQMEDCPGNGTLVPSKNSSAFYCACVEGYTPIKDGKKCVLARRYGEACEVEDSNDNYLFTNRMNSQCLDGARCLDRVCKCVVNAGHIWSNYTGQCVVKLGGHCLHTRDKANYPCTPNSACELDPRASSRCTCPTGYDVTSAGECYVPFGVKCMDAGNCNIAFGQFCIERQCQCRDLLGHFYDAEHKMCRGLVGSACKQGLESFCAPGAHCDPSTGKCVCDTGWLPVSTLARCFKALRYGANCSAGECDFNKGLVCNTGTGSAGQCECADSSMVYNTELGACLAGLGVQCGSFVVPGSCVHVPPSEGREGQTGPPVCEHFAVACEPGAACLALKKASGSDNTNVLSGGYPRKICQANGPPTNRHYTNE